MGQSDLKTKTTLSLFWSFLDKFGEQLIFLVSSIVLMNIVDVSAYGMMGVLLIFTIISRLLADSGFGRAMINRKTLSDTELSSVFYFNIGLSFLLYALFFICAPLIATLFDEPRLNLVSKVLFLGFLFHSFGIIHQTLLIKKADFRGLTKINIPALLIASIVAIILALNGYDIWALVAQNVAYAFLRTIFLWCHSSWRPVKMFRFKVIQSFFAFSNKLLLSGFIGAFFNNIYPALIALFYPNSMNQVGYYSQANKYQDIPFGVISNAFRIVSLVILSEVNEEVERMKRVVRKTMKSISFLVFPIGMFMILGAQSAFNLLFGTKWDPAVPYFQILVLAGMISPYTFILNEIFIVRERADFFLGVEIVKRMILVLLIFALFRFGIMGLVVSWVIYTFITLIISLILSRKLIGYSIVDFLKDALPYLLIAMASSVIGYLSTKYFTSNILVLLIGAISIFGSYWLICKLFKLELIKEIGSIKLHR